MFVKIIFDGDNECYINIYNITNVVVDGGNVTIYMMDNEYPINVSLSEVEPLMAKLVGLVHNGGA